MTLSKFRAAEIAIALLALHYPSTAATGESALRSRNSTIEPIEDYQTHIVRALDAITKSDRAHKYENAGRTTAELLILRDLAKGNDVELVRQLAYAATKWRVPQETLVILDFFRVLKVDDDAIVDGLAPYLNADGVLGELTRLCFRRLGGAKWAPDSPLEPVNYSAFKDYIERQRAKGEALPEAFVEWIYQRAPNHALLAFLYAHEGDPPRQREVLWNEHIVNDAIWRRENGFNTEFQNVKPDAISSLHKLSINENWWARLYVAEIMRKYPEFRVDVIVERLTKDENDLVRNVTVGNTGE